MDEITPIYTLSLVGHCAHCDITASKVEEPIFAPKHLFFQRKIMFKKWKDLSQTERNSFSKIVFFADVSMTKSTLGDENFLLE